MLRFPPSHDGLCSSSTIQERLVLARLTIVEKGRSRIYDICEEVVRIGGSSDNNIELSDPSASKSHCEIRQTSKGFRLVDLESKHGTAVNGDFVNQAVLEPGDKVQVGKSVLVFEEASSARVQVQSPARSTGGRARRPAPVPLRSRDDDGERSWHRHKKGMPGWAVGLIVAGSAGLLMLMVFGIISSSSKDDPGVTVIRQAQFLYDEGEPEKALTKLKEVDGIRGVPAWALSERDRLAGECNNRLEEARLFGLHNQAKREMNLIYRFVEKSTDYAEINRKLDEVVKRYEDHGDIVKRLGPELDRLRKKYPRPGKP